MMTYEMVMDILKNAGADLSIEEWPNVSQINVTVQDLEGFDKFERPIYRELDNEELVDSIYDLLELSALHSRVHNDMFRYFTFNNFVVCWGYASS